MEAVLDEDVVAKALKRDGYACSSCGLTPKATILRVVWVSQPNDAKARTLSNAITLCPECCIEPSRFRVPPRLLGLSRTIEEIASQNWQLDLYERQARRKIAAKKKIAAALLRRLDADHVWTDDQHASAHAFISRLGQEEVQRAVGIAVATGPKETSEGKFRYFCGICWNWINRT